MYQWITISPYLPGAAGRWCPQDDRKEEQAMLVPLLSGYCDSNTGPSGPKPDALANCATPRFP